MTLSLILDAVVIFLLIGTISYTFVLNKKLSILRQDRAALEKLLHGLISLTEKTERSIKSLKKAAQESLDQVDERFENSQAMRDELTFLVERGERVCDQLTNYIEAARKFPAPKKAEPEREIQTAPRPPHTPGSGPKFSPKKEDPPFVDFQKAKEKQADKGGRSNENGLLKTLRKIR